MSVQANPAPDAIEILIAEDSLTQAEQLRYLLEQHGYSVTVANDGKQALALVNDRKPALVISDIVMPELNGYQLCQRIKADERTRDPLPEVLGDESQLVQLFQQLIGNAVKFRCKAAPNIHIHAEALHKTPVPLWQFSVRDNGIGIDPQYFQRIFVICQRLHPKDVYPGIGFGLAICKKIVESHSGSISVVSQPGEGSTFSFTIRAPQ
jgi:light-regulated signal transduction histidine kinase (bacteriophytochrome)